MSLITPRISQMVASNFAKPNYRPPSCNSNMASAEKSTMLMICCHSSIDSDTFHDLEQWSAMRGCVMTRWYASYGLVLLCVVMVKHDRCYSDIAFMMVHSKDIIYIRVRLNSWTCNAVRIFWWLWNMYCGSLGDDQAVTLLNLCEH